MSARRPIEIRAEVDPMDLAWLRGEPVGMIDRIDAEVTVQIDGHPLFVTRDGAERPARVPILVFLGDFGQAVHRLKDGKSSRERVGLTATLFAIVLERGDTHVMLRVYETGSKRGKFSRRTPDKMVASTSLTLEELVAEFRRLAEQTLAVVLATNPRFKENREVDALVRLSGGRT